MIGTKEKKQDEKSFLAASNFFLSRRRKKRQERQKGSVRMEIRKHDPPVTDKVLFNW